MTKTVLILFSLLFLKFSYIAQTTAKNSNGKAGDSWSFLMIDSNAYVISWDMGIQESSIYFLGKKYNESLIKKSILKINGNSVVTAPI